MGREDSAGITPPGEMDSPRGGADAAVPARIGGQFYRLDVAITRLLAALARRRGVTLSEIAALQHLQITGGLTAGQLAERLQMTTGAVTALVDRLERGGHLRRSPHPRDRRSTVLTLTDAGLREILLLVGPYLEEVGATAAALGAEEAAAVERFLERTATITETYAAAIGSKGR